MIRRILGHCCSRWLYLLMGALFLTPLWSKAEDQPGESIPEDEARPEAPGGEREAAADRGGLFAGVQLDRPRAGPGSEALNALGRCIDQNDLACLDGAFHGGEMVVRRARAALDEGSLEIERAGLVDYFLKHGRALGEDRFNRVLRRPLEQCRISLLAASRGRCDDTGWVEPPESPLDGADPAYKELLEGMWDELGDGLEERRARRLVCGVVRIGDRIVAEEALVVLATREGSEPAFVDVVCSEIDSDPRTREREEGQARPQPPPWPPANPDDHGALMALFGVWTCLSEGGGRCFERRAPLPGVLVRDFMARLLGEEEASERQAIIDAMRVVATQSAVGARKLHRITPRQCFHLALITDPKRCTALEHSTESLSIPQLSPALPLGESSQARALASLTWGSYLDKEALRSRIRCPWPDSLPGSSEERSLELDVIWTRGERDRPMLLDMECKRPQGL